MRLPAKILVVDDEAIMCRSCLRVLGEDGYDVSIAQTGEEALRKIESDCYDVAILDLRIPGSGGLTVLRAIRKASPETEVVVITGYPSVENAKESIRLGAFDFVTKPFVPQTLRTVVSQVLACKPWKMLERC
ncbi:MAG: response regulator [Planctomycetota bacterium]